MKTLKKITTFFGLAVIIIIINSLAILPNSFFSPTLLLSVVFLFIFFTSGIFSLCLALFGGLMLSFYSFLPLFSLAFLFFLIGILIAWLKKNFEKTNLFGFCLAFISTFFIFHLFLAISSKNIAFLSSSLLKEFALALIFNLFCFFILKKTLLKKYES